MNKRAAFLAVSVMLSGAAMAIGPAHAQLFGESDEEKAARQAHEDGQDAKISQLGDRVSTLEGKVTSLTETLAQATGEREQLTHQVQELRQKLDAQQKDFAYRLCMLSAQQLGAAGDQGLNCGGVTSQPQAANAPPAGSLQPGAPLPPIGTEASQATPQAGQGASPAQGQPTRPQQPMGKPPGTLGTLSANAAPPPSAPVAQAQPRSQYQLAMNYLGKAQYAEASAAFRSYADGNPDDKDLAPQALYWIGDIAYVQHDYPTAARAFAEQLKKYPQSGRSPESMLKLGQSLLAEGQTSNGCTTLGAIKIRYPKAPSATLAAATGARKAACR